MSGSLVRRFLCRKISSCRSPAAVVQGFLVYDVEDDLGIDIAAEGAGADLGVSVVGRPLEVGDGLDGVAVVDRIAASVQEPQPVEELEYVGGGLVDIDHYQPSFIGLFLEQVDYLLGVGG